MVGLYKRRKNNTTDAALDFALPTTNTAGGLQQAQVTAMQDEIHVLKKQLLEVCPFTHPLYKSECHYMFVQMQIYIYLFVFVCLCVPPPLFSCRLHTALKWMPVDRTNQFLAQVLLWSAT